MPWLNVVLLLYAILNIVMGCLGYIRAGSPWSIIAGTAAGAIILGTLAWAKVNPRSARITALVVAALLLGRFAPKTIKENELYPSGIMFVTSLAVVLCLLIGHLVGMKAKKKREATDDKGS